MMNALEAILRRPKTVLTVMVVLLIAGINAYISLPKESMPNIDVPYLYVSVSQTGLSPRDAETLLARPLERELRDIENLVSINSTSVTGHASIFLEFSINADIDKAMADTRQAVDGARGALPDDANEPTVNEVDISGFPTITVAVSGDVPERTLTAYAEELQDAIEAISTVRDVTLSGTRKDVLEVTVDLLRLEAYAITTNELFDAVSRNNLAIPAGTLDTGQGRFNLEVPGLITSQQDVLTLPLKTVNGNVITFSDVATVTPALADATEYTRANGAPALILGVNKRTGTNIIDNSAAVRAVVEQVTADWPAAISVNFMLDQARTAEELLVSLESSVMTAIALVMVVAVAMLGLRPALLIGLSIPISFMVAFLFIQFLGYTVNMMVMFGLVLCVGLLVDGAVVLVEYAERKIAEGVPRKDAFIRAARLMAVPIFSSMATTIAAFLPLLLWPGIIGKFMSFFPIMVIVTLTASIITAMVFLPVVGGLIARKRISADEQQKALALSSASASGFDVRKVPGLTGFYVRALSVLVKRPLMVLVGMIATLGTIGLLYMANPSDVVSFPEVEPEFATVAVTARGNYSPDQIRDLLIEVEQRVLEVDGIAEMILNFGSTGAVAAVPGDTIGNLQLELAPWKDRVPARAIFDDILALTASIPGVGVEIVGAEQGPPTGKDINLTIRSESYEALLPVVAQVRAYVETELGNAVDVEDGLPLPGINWQVSVDREQAARFGVSVRELSPYVQLVTSGVTIGSYTPPGANDTVDIILRLPEDERTFSALDSMRIVTPGGLVPVSNFIERHAVPDVASITRENQTYAMSVLANVSGTDASTGQPASAARKVDELRGWLAGQDWPEGTEFSFGGADEQTQETAEFLSQAGIAVIFLMFIILLIQFNSFYQVFLTLSTVVMSTAGVLLGLIVTGQSFSAIMTGIGIVSLAGIVVTNSIILIDTYNRFRSENVDPVTATLMTAAQRVRPILLTVSTTVMGLLPMALGINIDFFNRTLELGGLSGAWWSQLTTAVVSGLLFSTTLTLVTVPVFLAAPHVLRTRIVAASRTVRAAGMAVGGFLSARRPQKPHPAAHKAPAAPDTATIVPATIVNAPPPSHGALIGYDPSRATPMPSPRQAAE